MQIRKDYISKRARNHFIFTSIIIGLSLFFFGVLVWLAIAGESLMLKAKTQVAMRVFLEDGIPSQDLENLKSELSDAKYSEKVVFVSKKEAEADAKEVLGEDFVEILDGESPIKAYFEVYLTADYLSEVKIKEITRELTQNKQIYEVDFPMQWLLGAEENTKELLTSALVAAIVIGLISFILVHNTIKLTIYSKRLIIRSMQLIGATNSFIRRPFLMRGILQGLLAALVASGLLFGGIFALENYYQALKGVLWFKENVFSLAILLIFGALIGYLSSWFAVSSYLNKDLNKLA